MCRGLSVGAHEARAHACVVLARWQCDLTNPVLGGEVREVLLHAGSSVNWDESHAQHASEELIVKRSVLYSPRSKVGKSLFHKHTYCPNPDPSQHLHSLVTEVTNGVCREYPNLRNSSPLATDAHASTLPPSCSLTLRTRY